MAKINIEGIEYLRIKELLTQYNRNNKEQETYNSLSKKIFVNEMEAATARSYFARWNNGKALTRLTDEIIDLLCLHLKCTRDELICIKK